MSPTHRKLLRILLACYPEPIEAIYLRERAGIRHPKTLTSQLCLMRKQGIMVRHGTGGYRLEQPPMSTYREVERPYCGRITVRNNSVWCHTSEHERMATPGECAREIIKLRAKIAFLRQMVINCNGTPIEVEQMERMIERKFATAIDDQEVASIKGS
jgi:hypothetical protein